MCLHLILKLKNTMDILNALVAAGYNIMYIMFDNNGIMTVIATHGNRHRYK